MISCSTSCNNCLLSVFSSRSDASTHVHIETPSNNNNDNDNDNGNGNGNGNGNNNNNNNNKNKNKNDNNQPYLVRVTLSRKVDKPVALISGSNWNLVCWFFCGGSKTGEPGQKPSEPGREQHVTPSPGIEPGSLR